MPNSNTIQHKLDNLFTDKKVINTLSTVYNSNQLLLVDVAEIRDIETSYNILQNDISAINMVISDIVHDKNNQATCKQLAKVSYLAICSLNGVIEDYQDTTARLLKNVNAV